ncbi:MAG: hypothetical protein FJY98_02680 [Candidatus Liptonbacteria bacterium]|nr:hypothetical protein [Candidatus Liptonbacteria bacterium]
MLKFIFDLVIWGLVPTLLGMALWEVYKHTAETADKRASASSRGGFWAGFFLFIIVLIYQVSGFFKTAFPAGDIYRGFDLWLAFSGAILTFLLFSGGKKVIPPRLKGWSIFSASFLVFYATFHYFFIRTYNEFLLSVVLGVALGLFVHHIVYPAVKSEIQLGHGGGHH